MKAFEMITNQLIELINKKIDSDWQMSWMNIEGLGMAKNAQTQRAYKGINQMMLTLISDVRGYSFNDWMTFKQAKNLGGKVKKGASSFPVVYWAFKYFDPITEKRYNNEQKNELPEDVQKRLISTCLGARYFNVFNVEEIEGLEDSFYEIDTAVQLKENFEKNEIAEDVLNNCGAEIRISPSNRAFYRPATDSIQLPLREQFIGEEEFYKVAFHELTHWTGHESRLNRLKLDGDKKDYAFEELVAELGAVFVACDLGFNADMTNNVEYLKSWLKCLKNDSEFIVKASLKADKAKNYIMGEYEKRSLQETKVS